MVLVAWILYIGWIGLGWEKCKGMMLFHVVANFRKDGVKALSRMHNVACREIVEWMETSDLGEDVVVQTCADLSRNTSKLCSVWPHRLQGFHEFDNLKLLHTQFPKLWPSVDIHLVEDMNFLRETYIRKVELCLHRLAIKVGWYKSDFSHNSRCLGPP